MYIVKEDALGFIRAFHGQQNEILVAVIILTVRRRDLSFFTSLLNGVAEIDRALGKEIGLFLFHPDQSPGLVDGGRGGRVLAGERLVSPFKIGAQTRANNFYHSLGSSIASREDIADLVAQSSVNIVQDFCDLLKIDENNLPCVCTLIRGAPGAIVSRAEDRLSFESIVRAAENLRPHVESARQRWDGLVSDLPNVKNLTDRLNILISREEKVCRELSKFVASLERKYGIILQPQFEAMLNVRSLTSERIDALFAEVSGEGESSLVLDSRSQGVRSRASLLAEIWQEMNELTETHNEDYFSRYPALAESIQQELRRAAEAAFSEAGITIWRYRDIASPLAKAAPILGLVTRVIGAIRRANGVP